MALNKEERNYWYSLPESDGQNTKWLLQAIAAKDAMRRWIEKNCGRQLASADITVMPSGGDKPRLSCTYVDIPLPEVTLCTEGEFLYARIDAETNPLNGQGSK